MTEVIKQKANEPIVLSEVFFVDPEKPDTELSLEEASAVAARYMVAKAFSHGLRQEGILFDIARHKTEPLDFVKSVRMLWGTGPTRRHEEIDEIDIMYKAHTMGLFDIVFPFPKENEVEPADEIVSEDETFEPNDEELLELEQELHSSTL